jgi:hypothetical protein
LAFFASQERNGHGVAFAVAVVAFLGLISFAIWVQQSADWSDTFNGHELIDLYVDRDAAPEVMLRDLTVFGQDDLIENAGRLARAYSRLRWAIALMAGEIAFLTLDLWI